MNRVQLATQNLLEYREILEELGIIFWLDGGTLLGAYRDNDFCKDDEDDIDLCTWDNYIFLVDEIIDKTTERGFKVLHRWKLELCIERHGLRIDLFFNRKNCRDAFTHLYQGERINKYVVIPIRYYEVLEKIEFKGEIFLAPSPIEEYLTRKYGDWRTPVHRSEYRSENQSQNKFIRESYG